MAIVRDPGGGGKAMAERKRRFGGRLAALAAVVAAALLAVRLAGPGGSPAVKPEGPSPAPPPPAAGPAPDPRPAPPPAKGPALRGRVLSAAGTPVEGARVEALFEMGPGKEPVVTAGGPTGADGEWALADAPADWKGVLLRAVKGPLSAVADMGEVPGTAADGMAVDIPLPPTFDVGGLAISAEEGRALEDMEIRVGDRTARTDARGRFLVEGLPAREPFPGLEARGAGRKPLRIPLPADRPLDDLLLRVERE